MLSLQKKKKYSRLYASILAILTFMLLSSGICAGCVSSAKGNGESVVKAQKGYYPEGCVVTSTDGRMDIYLTETYVLTAEAYRAILLGE